MRQAVCVVNPRSGGGQGAVVAQALRARFGTEQVFDLLSQGSAQAIALARARHWPLLVAGGDGSVTSLLDQLGERGPALAVLPLGTGNDLARALGMPSQAALYLKHTFDQLTHVVPSRLDRWRLRGPGINRTWYAYWSLGADARVAARFDQLRKRHSRWFPGVGVNRAWYAGLGLGERGRPVAVTFSGQACTAPTVLALSVATYAGGSRLWPNNHGDKRFELLGLPSHLRLGLVLQGLRRPRYWGRHASLQFHVHQMQWAQCDGEALRLQAGAYHIDHAGWAQVLALPAQGAVR